MLYNFDEPIDRSASHCVKIERMKDIWKRTDLLPLWVADIDFKSPPCVLEAIQERLKHGIMGYTVPHDGYYTSIVNWVHKRYGMEVERRQIQFVPGIVPGIYVALQALTEKGDKIVIQQPVYHPFKHIIEGSGRICVNNPLMYKEGTFGFDFDDLQERIKGCKLLILCNPHNPGGMVWSQKELERLAETCAQNGVTVISDEIHADLALPPNRHTPFAMASETAKEIAVTFMAPSKAFNIPGLVAAHALVMNNGLRERLFRYIRRNDLELGNVFAYIAVEAAYTHGEEWLEQLIAYLLGNIDFVDNYLKSKMPQIRAIRPQASFLVFLDGRGLGFGTQEELDRFFVEGAKLALNSGTLFGEEGKGFMRMNIATQRSVLEQAMMQMEGAMRQMEGAMRQMEGAMRQMEGRFDAERGDV